MSNPRCAECGNYMKRSSDDSWYCDFRECSLDGVAIKETEKIQLPNGYTLYWEKNLAGGRTYVSDEVGGGVTVWDTALVEESTLLAALVQEAKLAREDWNKHDAESLREQQRHAEEFSIASKPIRSEPEGMLHRIWQKIFPIG